MQKILQIISYYARLAATMMVVFFLGIFTAQAADKIESYTDSDGVIWRYVRTNQDEVIIQGADYETLTRHLYMPDTIKGCKVTEVGDYAFAYCDELEFVYISKGVKKIGIGAFARCEGLIDVYLPDSLLTISSHAFWGCQYLDDISLPERLEYIGYQAFYCCYSLHTELRIPDSIKYIGNQAFAYCYDVYGLSIPEYLSFKDGLLEEEYAGIEVEYGIGNLFESCIMMTDVSVRLGVGENLEFKTNGLSWCSSNNGLYIKNKKEDTLFHLAFCPGGLTSFTIDKSTITIAEDCFGSYSNLEYINVQSGNSMYAAAYGVLYSSDYKDLIFCPRRNGMVNGMAESVTNILHQAIGQNDVIKSVHISQNVKNIGSMNFGFCHNLKGFTVDENNQYYSTNDGFLCTKDGASIISAPRTRAYLEFPEGTESISMYASMGNNKTYQIKLPNGLKNIGIEAFGWCTELTKVNIPQGVTNIEMVAFWACQSLTSISIPSSVKCIGLKAFSECSELTHLTIENGVLEINDSAFELCTSLETVEIPVSVTNICGGAFGACEQLKSARLPRTLKEIVEKNNVFEGCSKDLRITYYDVPLSILVAVAEESKGMGKVTGGKNLLAGNTATLKATANSGYLFSHWEGPLPLTVNRYSPSISFIALSSGTFTAHFIPVKDDVAAISFMMPKDCPNGVAIANVAIDVSGCTSLPTVKVAGLPAGLKFTAKPIYKKGSKTEIEVPANTIYGTPTKSGVYTVVATVTTAGKKSATCSQTVIVRKEGEKVVVAECDAIGGKVTGGGVYATGKNVALKATANKGYVFAGWYEDVSLTTPCDSTVTDYRNPSYTYLMGDEDKTFYARFVPVEDDKILGLTFSEVNSRVGNCQQRAVSLREFQLVTLVNEWDPEFREYYGSGVCYYKVILSKGMPATIWIEGGDAAEMSLSVFTDWESDCFTCFDYGSSDGGSLRFARLSADDWHEEDPSKEIFYVCIEGDIGSKANLHFSSSYLSVDELYTSTFIAEGETCWQVAVDSLSLPKVAVKGLPAGMKFTAKPIYKKGSKTEIEVPANTIYGAPTKPGVYKVSVSLTNTSIKKAVVNDFEIVVPNLKDDLISVEDAYGPYVPGVAYTNTIATAAGCTVSGLPAGMKWTAKDILDNKTKQVVVPANSAYGAPTKPGKYTVYFTKTVDKVKHTATATFVVGDFPVVNVVTVGSGTGKVTGVGAFAANKKVTLKATADTKDDANKGTKKSVFAGWYLDADGLSPVESTVDFRTVSLPYVMTAEPETTLYALFVTAEEDSDIMLYIKDKEITVNANDNNFVAEGTTILSLQMESISIPKAAVSGLPAGMKYTDKALTVKATKTEDAYEVPANAIYGTPTKPGLYTVTVKLTNTTIKKAIEKKFTIEVPNFMAANGYFIDDLDNGIGRKRVLSVGITNIDNFLPSLKLKSVTAKLAVSGLPAGLKYDASTGKITGIATKAGAYTVTLTVTEGKTKYVSTITIEVEALPDWVVGTFYGKEIARGIGYSEWVCPMQITVTISAVGKISIKGIEPGESGTSRSAQLTEVRDDGSYAFTVHHVSGRKGNDGYTEGDLEGVITPMVYGDNVEFGRCIIHDVGVCDEDDDPYESDGEAYQSLYSIKSYVSKLPAFVKNAVTTVNMNYMRDDDWDPYYGGYLTLKYGANGAVTTAYSETEGGRATATGSAQLVPYEVDGNITKAWLYTALKPRGRDPFGVLLFLSIDTSNGNVYGDDVEVDDYLLEVDD